MDKKEELGMLIRTMRLSRKMTQADLASKIKQSQSSITMYETGRREPDFETLEAMADAFNVPLQSLIPQNDELSNNTPSIPAPDYEKAATKAAEILVQFRISSAPVLPLQILNSLPGVLVRSFTEFADDCGLDRKELVSMYGSEIQDAITFSRVINGKQRYIVAYNQRMPFYMLQMSLARELAFIVLGTNDARQDEPRMAEALCFTRHLLCPRPLINAMMAHGLPLTVESVGSLTGCYGRCLAGIRETPGALVAAGLNRLIRQQFSSFVENLVEFGSIVSVHDDSPAANFGTFMDDYEE